MRKMIEALKFYTDLQRCAMPGPQFWRGARESYELGQSGMLVYSTHIMDDLVEGSGAEDGGKIEIAIEDLAKKSGFAPLMTGPGGDSASYGQLVVAAITNDADPEAQKVVEYFLTEGYINVLKLSLMVKVPALKIVLDEWKSLSEFFALYSDDTLNLSNWLGDLPEFHVVKGTDFADLSDRDIDRVMLRLNHCPHKCLGF